MKFQLIFNKTGDSIPLVSMNPDVVSYYVEQLNQKGFNRFIMPDQSWAPALTDSVVSIDQIINSVNKWLPDLVGIKLTVTNQETFYNQNTLNRLHAEWVDSQILRCSVDRSSLISEMKKNLLDLLPDDIKDVPLGTALSKLGKLGEYGQINRLVHKIETSFMHLNFSVVDEEWVEFPNPFKKSNTLSNSLAHFRMHPHHLGRLLYEKFIAFDNDFSHNDENSYNELLGFVSLHFVQSQTIPVSREYITWCKQNGKEPLGYYLNLGNIPDIDSKLEDYRMIAHRNVLDGNYFSIII